MWSYIRNKNLWRNFLNRKVSKITLAVAVFILFIIILLKFTDRTLNAHQQVIMVLLFSIFFSTYYILTMLTRTSIFQRYITFCKDIIKNVESNKTPSFLWVIGLVSIILLRNISEFFLSSHAILALFYLIEYTLFFISLFLAILLLMKFISNEKILNVLKIVAMFSPFIFTPMLIDPIVSLGKPFSMPYVSGNSTFVLNNFLTFYNYGYKTATTGIKIETIGACYLALIYILSKTNDIVKATFGTFALYMLSYFYMALPSFFNIFVLSNSEIRNFFIGFFGNWAQIFIWHIPLIAILFPITVYFYYKEKDVRNRDKYMSIKKRQSSKKIPISNKIRALIKNIRPLRSIHYIILVFLGISIGAGTIANINLIKTILCFVSIIFGWQFAVIINDIFDKDVDRLSNKRRPLIKNIFSVREYFLVGFFFFIEIA